MRKAHLTLLLKKRQANRNQRAVQQTAFLRPLTTGLLAIALILFAGVILVAGILYSRVTADLPSLEELPVLLNPVDGELLEPTRITDRSGETTLYTIENPGVSREFLAINPDVKDHFSPQLVRSVVANLEPDFWQSTGVSTENWFDPQPRTIAERLASELLLWDEPDSSMRAIRMRILAGQLVSKYGRTQVLEWYLNSVWFGHEAFGAESAAILYFNKHASDLTLGESAMLSVLINAPALNPIDAPEAALELQRLFLAEIAQNLTITTDEFSVAIHEELPIQKAPTEAESMASAFTQRLLQSLDNEFPHKRLERGGLVVRSTLDLNLQNQFICTAETQMARLQGAIGFTDPAQGDSCAASLLLPTQIYERSGFDHLGTAGVILDPQNGEVLAYVPPTTFDGQTQADEGYQPGSLLSPFAALAGFASGLSPSSLEWDVPLPAEDMLAQYTNPDGSWHGPTNIRSSVANEYLIPIANIIRQVGPANTWQMASMLGITSIDPLAESETLLFEGGSTRLLEIATAYATLANSGNRSGALDSSTQEIEPNMVIEIRSITNRLFLDRTSPQSSLVVNESLSYLINHVLSDESARWPSLGFPNSLEIGQTVAAKTGIISSASQVWTVGYTPKRLVLVWMGNTAKDETNLRLDVQMAAGLWHALMKYTLKDQAASNWPVPAGVAQLDVCFPSGMLPSTDCPLTANEVFLAGNEPTRADNLYEKIMINRETGQRATVFTNPTMIEEKLFINVPIEARQWAMDAGLAVAPSGYDAITIAQMNPEVNISSPVLFSPVSGQIEVEGTASGEGFSSYSVQIGEGINPAAWIQIGEGSAQVIDGSLAQWDTSALNGLYAIRLTVLNADKTVRSATIQVTVDNSSPLVKITYPVNGQTLNASGSQVTLVAEIEDSSGIANVEWRVDGKLVHTQTEGPFLHLMAASEGQHTLEITAVDKAGNASTTGEVEFNINR